MKPVFSSLRKIGHVNVCYLDDSLLISNTYDNCFKNIEDMSNLLDSFGFTIHLNKSVFVPSQVITFLEFIIDSISMTIKLTDEKKDNLIQDCLRLQNKREVVIRDLAQVVGKMVASEPGVEYAALYYKPLEQAKTLALKQSKGNFDDKMLLDNQLRECIKWWIENVKTSNKLIVRSKPDIVLKWDSSKTGWGGLVDKSKLKTG